MPLKGKTLARCMALTSKTLRLRQCLGCDGACSHEFETRLGHCSVAALPRLEGCRNKAVKVNLGAVAERRRRRRFQVALPGASTSISRTLLTTPPGTASLPLPLAASHALLAATAASASPSLDK